MTGARDTYRTLTVWSVLLVAAIAAAVSYLHIESLAIRYGQPELAAVLLPVSIDGTVAVSSLAMLRAARAGSSAPWLARTMLLLAVGATVACNVGYGLAHGVPGALLSGWPAVAFIGSAEIAISMSRRSSQPNFQADLPEGGPETRADLHEFSALNGHAAAALELFAGELAAGTVPSIRAVRDRMSVGQPKAQQIQAYLRTRIEPES